MQQLNKLLLQAQSHSNNPWEGKNLDLSEQYDLTLADYQLLANIIHESAFLEIIKLPPIQQEHTEKIIDLLADATLQNSTLIEIENFIPQEIMDNQTAVKWQTIQSRLERNRKRIFAIHGGGNIGLGLMADMISKSPFYYSTWATSSDSFTNNLINCNHRLWLQLKAQRGNEYTCVNSITMLNSRNPVHIKNLYIHANLAALCLTEVGFISVAPLIAQGLIARYKTDQAGLKILVLMNKPQCERFVHQVLSEELIKAAQSTEALASIQIIPTVVDRIVNRIPKEKVLTNIQTQLSNIAMDLQPDYGFLEPNQAFKEQIPALLNNPSRLRQAVSALDLQIPLFNVEKHYALYVPQTFNESSRFAGMKKTKDLVQLTAIKNKYLNGPHAIMAWIGALLGYQTIYDAINNRALLQFIKHLMRLEIGPILQSAYTNLESNELNALKTQFIERCKANKEDPIKRVARDPLRKLNSGGCIRGLIELKTKFALNFATPRLEFGVAAALLYATRGMDTSNKECQKMQEIYQRRQSYQDILCYKGAYASSTYPGLDAKKDYLLINRVLYKITLLEKILQYEKEKRTEYFFAAVNGSYIYKTIKQQEPIVREKRH